ncbi:hypothetical protein ACWD62_21010 [Streptomyces sp. NPDC005146]
MGAGPYTEVPRATGVSSAEIIGAWRCTEDTEVTMRADGTAVVKLLDGQDFDFDSQWRLSGTGTCELTDQDIGMSAGQHVSLIATRRTSSSWPEVKGAEEGSVGSTDIREPVPDAYTGNLELERGDKGLALYFIFSDPDNRNTYYLEKKQSAANGSVPSSSAPPPQEWFG